MPDQTTAASLPPWLEVTVERTTFAALDAGSRVYASGGDGTPDRIAHPRPLITLT